MGPTLVQFIYVSAAKWIMTDEELAPMLQAWRANNQGEGITGILVYSDGSFMQVLEGPPENVRRMVSVITADSRHSFVTPLTEDSVEERFFPEWTMGFARLGQDALLALDGSNDFYAQGTSLLHIGPGKAKQLLEVFRRNNP